MRRFFLAWVVLQCAAALTGCKTLYDDYSVRPIDVSTVEAYQKLTAALQSPQSVTAAGATANTALIDPACFGHLRTGSSTVRSCTAQRNQAVAALVIGSSEACLAHRRSMYGTEAAFNITAGTFTNLFAGAASVVTAERSKSVLAALALFSNSERSLVNESVYKQMLVTSVDKKIVETREVRMQEIYNSLKSKDVAAYSVHEALRDVILLHNSCSFIDGLQKALQEGTQDTPALKIARLRSTLSLLIAERANAADKSVHAIGLDERIKAIQIALLAEEVR